MPTLDADTWIVVPFDNLAKAEDAEWLRGASVNLLYLDMSRWKDIRVIDDERVADLLRETPEASGSAALSLNAGLAVAKRAGAGKLVMGDVLKLGNRTTVTAKVFDVKSGQRVRSVKEDAIVQDSVMPLFGKLAQKILNVAPPAGANVGALGTTRTDAYQAYLAGITALNAFDLREARKQFNHAIALDSAFALAHYKMATVIGWDDPQNALQRQHAEAAARHSAGLPARARALITGTVHQAKTEWTRACAVYSGLIRADSNDVEALYGLGECLYHDFAVVPTDGDTTRMRFLADWHKSVWAFSRVLELDPQYHLAYQHIIDALMAERQSPRFYCVENTRCRQYYGMNVRIGDSLVSVPVVASDTALARAQARLYVQTRSRRRNLAAARQIAEQWVAAAPNESRSLSAAGAVALQDGRIADAHAYFMRVTQPGTFIESLGRHLMRMEVAYKQGNMTESNRLYDSLRASPQEMPNSTNRLGNAAAFYSAPFGRIVEFDSVIAAMRPANAPPELAPYQRRIVRLILGASVDDSLAHFEKQMFETTRRNRGSVAATRQISTTLAYALRMPRPQWPELDTTVTDAKVRPAIALMRGDTAALRRAAAALDSLAQTTSALAGPDSGFSYAATEAYLALRDTAAAQRAVRFGLDGASAATIYFPMQANSNSPAVFVPGMMLLRADLAAARGQRDEAREWYRRFIDAWSKAPAEMQPVVERARRARAALGG